MRGPVVAGLLLAGCGSGAAGDQHGIPTPDLEAVEADVVAAIERERAAVEADPSSVKAWGELGGRYFAHEFMDAAAACYERAGELEPDEGKWPYRVGWARFDDRPEEALAWFERALATLSEYAPAREAIARALVRLGREDEAAEHFRAASELDPRSAHAETGLGGIALARGDFEAARTHFEEALARDQKHVEAHIGLSQAYAALGRKEDARRHAEASRDLPPTSPRTDWLAAVNVAPAGVTARTRYGLQLQRQGNDEEAAEQFRIVLESNPAHVLARQRLAGLLAKQGRREEARALLREGLTHNPRSAELRQALEKLGG